MTHPAGGELRRSFPPPHRTTNPLGIAVRWRRELAAVVAVGLGLRDVGPGWTGAAVGIAVAAVLAVPSLRRLGIGVVQSTVAAHRVRAGFLHAGVGGRTGRLPWILSARGQGDAVVLSVWLPAGCTIADVGRASDVLAAACGAAAVQLVRNSPRQDRVLLVVLRPRWGWWSR